MSLCAICLNELKVGGQYKTICNHIFCNECITQWKKINISCPLCRAQIQPLEYVPPYDAICIRDIACIQKLYETDNQKAVMLHTEYMKWLAGTRYSRPII
jgi:hypothetical protein